MEKVYNSTLLPYSSGVMCLSNFFEQTHSLIRPYVQGKLNTRESPLTIKKREEYMLPLLGENFDSVTFKKLSKACASDQFAVEGQCKEININVSKRQRILEKCEIPQDTQLETLQLRRLQNSTHNKFLRYTPSIWLEVGAPSWKVEFSKCSNQRINLKNMLYVERCLFYEQTSHDALSPDHLMSESWDVDAQKNDLVPGESLVIVLKIYHSFKHKLGEPANRVPQASQEVVVLGCNTLAEFRDKITCLTDDLISCDVSENPTSRVIVKGIDKYPSGMFFINNKFYIDKRHPESIDYSDIVKEWARQRNIKLGETFLMENTKFEDMSIRLGYPYLYQHQGNCEHLICFTDVRILHESDPLQSLAYPLITCYFRRNVPHCMCCTNSIARWLTTGNCRLPHDPFYFCDLCFMSFNYVDGKKIGEFKAYPFESCDTSEFVLCHGD